MKTFPAKKTLVIILFGLILIVFWMFDPTDENMIFWQCPFYKLTGWQCPGCGSQRAFHSILHGELSKAFLFNPLLFCSIPYFVFGYLLEKYRSENEFCQKLWNIFFGKLAILFLIAIVLGFSIWRNWQ
jgi:hypothetical protein